MNAVHHNSSVSIAGGFCFAGLMLHLGPTGVVCSAKMTYSQDAGGFCFATFGSCGVLR